MTQELMAKIVNQELYSTLLIIILSFLLCWWTLFRLCYLLLGVKVGIKQIAPAIFIMAAYSFWSKLFIPLALVGIIMPIIFAFLLWITAKGINYLKAILVAFITILISQIGPISFTFLLCAAYPKINSFLFRSPLGIAAGTWLENIIPALALVILPKILPRFKFLLIPPISAKPERIDFMVIFTYFSMYSMNYFAVMAVYICFMKNYHFILLLQIIIWTTAVSTVFGHYRIVKTFEKEKNELKADKARLEAEKQQIEMDRARLEKEKLSLEQDKYRLEDEKRQLEYEKGQLKNEKGNLENEKVKLEIEKNQVIGEKDQLEKEKTDLAKDLQELIAANKEGAKSHKLQKLVKDFAYRVMHIENSEEEQNIDFTDRELSVINLIEQGKNAKEMAAILHMTEGSVRNVFTALYRKLKVHDKTQLALYVSNLIKSK